MTLSELVTQVRSIINETDPLNSHFGDSQLTVWINEAIRYIVTRIEELPITWSELTAATDDIAISTDTLLINEAYIYNPQSLKYDLLEVVDYSALKHISPTWLSDDVGTPKYLARKGNFGVYLFPQPDSNYVGQTIKTAGVSFPVQLANDSDEPTLPKNMHDVVPHYAAYRAFEQLGMGDKAGSELMLCREAIKSTKHITTKFSTNKDVWMITDDNI